MRVAVFDLDGTLADTSADLIAAANGALAEAGHRRRRSIRSATGRSPSPAAGRCCGPGSGGSARPTRRRSTGSTRGSSSSTGAALAVHTRLYDGAEAALDRLAARRLAARGLHQQARAAGAGCCSRRSGSPGGSRRCSAPTASPGASPTRGTCSRRSRAPAARRERAVLVGDTVTDRDAARAAGVPCVLVGFGPDGRRCRGAGAGGAGRAFRRAARRARAAGAGLTAAR